MDPHWPNLHYPDQQQLILQKASGNPVSERGDRLQQQLSRFWQRQRVESEQGNDYRNHSLPLARIKKIMKTDEDVRMISAEAPVLLSKACEMFIQDLTLRSWMCTEENRRRTLQRGDISAALSTTDLFDFLVDIVPREKPIVPLPAPPVMPFLVTPRNTAHQQQDLTLGEGSGVGLTMSLPVPLGWSGPSHQTDWPQPDL